MINSLVKPEESEFDMKRFWEHSVGTAIIADKLVTDRLVRLGKPLEFNDYWIGALLHDVGKLVLGSSSGTGCTHPDTSGGEESFRQAEVDLIASHQRVGQLMLLNSDMGENAVNAVGNHHELSDPDDLLRLLHVADNLAKSVGLGTLPGEEAEFDADVLKQMGLSSDRVVRLSADLQKEMVQEIRSVVASCL
jgi:HD-like signal output (HDOD) protein